MAIACEACGKPVHEQAVVCPHCALPTGVPSDPRAQRQIAELPALARSRRVEPLPLDAVLPPIAVPRAVARRRRRR